MSAEHSHRWQHRTHATAPTHWPTDPADKKPHAGIDPANCPLCHPKEATNEA